MTEVKGGIRFGQDAAWNREIQQAPSRAALPVRGRLIAPGWPLTRATVTTVLPGSGSHSSGGRRPHRIQPHHSPSRNAPKKIRSALITAETSVNVR